MLLVIRSPHGEAEVSVDRNGTDPTVGDLLLAVTGEAAPSSLFVDGRAVTAIEPLAAAAVDGSVVESAWPTPVASSDLELVVVAGPGSGIARGLGPGRFRIGPGRETRTRELADGTAVEARLELDVGSGGVRVRADGACLDGVTLHGTTRWDGGTLRVGDHAFALRRPPGRERRRIVGAGEAALFHRPPRDRPIDDRPTIADLVAWATSAAPALWHRRPDHRDAFVVPVGVDQAAAHGPAIDLGENRGVGIVADVETATATARGILLGLAVLHGPADFEVVVCTTPSRAPRWEWVKWLPHARSSGRPVMLTDPAAAHAWSEGFGLARPTGRALRTIVVADDRTAWTGRDAPLRALLNGSAPVHLVAVSDDRELLPAACTALVTAEGDGTVTVEDLAHGTEQRGVLPVLLDSRVALETARRLASLEDPELPGEDPTALPTNVPICPALGLDELDAWAISHRWELFEGRPVVAVGAASTGIRDIDLVADGPHVLVAGADGAAVGELLQSLTVGLAASCSPDDLEILLVDPDGDGELSACAALPHSVGVVTDLDEHGADRLLRCLRAELATRERQLLEQGAASFDARRAPDVERLPRLVVVVDRLDEIAAEAPGFVTGLVDVAQRGRTTGVHLVLACARPASVLDSRIRAQAHVRIALRLDDELDSIEVVGTRQAVRLPRATAGRAILRVGADAPTVVQTPRPSGHAGVGAVGMTVTPFVLARSTSPLEQRMLRAARLARPRPDDATDLERLLDVIGDAALAQGVTGHRVVYPAPLPTELTLDEMLDGHPGDGVPYGLADHPDEQRTSVRWWQPSTDGSLLVRAAPGSGATTLLVTLALGAAERFAPDDVHLYLIAADHQPLMPLYGLPHLGSLARLDDHERVERIVAHLVGELDRRSASAGGEPSVALFIDGLGRLLALDAELDDRWSSDIERIVRDGPAVGISTVATARLADDVPLSLAGSFGEQFLLQPDPSTLARFGFLRAEAPAFLPGRALAVTDRSEIQIALPPKAVAVTVEEIASASAGAARRPERIEMTSARVAVESVLDHAHHAVGRLSAPIGVDPRDRSPVAVALDHGGTAIVAGPPGSGRSTALAAIGLAAIAADDDLPIYVVAAGPGPTDELGQRAVRPVGGDVDGWVRTILDDQRPRLVLVDDVDWLAGDRFAPLATARDGAMMLVVVGTAERLRRPGLWTTALRRKRTGVLLQPAASDGDLLGVLLPRATPVPVGHGYVVNDAALVPVVTAVLGEQRS